MRLILTGGGTGGHIIPNIALVEAMRAKYPNDLEILYLASNNPLETELLTKADIAFKTIHTGKLRRYFSLSNITDIFKLALGLIESFFYIRSFNPDLVFSKGGYVSVPVVFGAYMLKKPIIIHESDIIPGLATKICARLARIICVSWKETLSYFKSSKRVTLTGIPMRKQLLSGDQQKAKLKFGLSDKKPLLLVMGGSSGAMGLNLIIQQCLSSIIPHFQIVHICGAGKKILPEISYSDYHAVEYLHQELFDLYAQSDIVISRAGANSIAELESLGKKAILVPLSLKASRGDQILNAEEAALQNSNFVVLKEEELNCELLLQNLDNLIKKPSVKTLAENHQNSSEKIIALMKEIAHSTQPVST